MWNWVELLSVAIKWVGLTILITVSDSMVHFVMVMWFGMGNPWHEVEGGCMRARDLGLWWTCLQVLRTCS